ncbi:hypothetical protein REPUB_Repub11eG0128600 [Reevesia pubescens]
MEAESASVPPSATTNNDPVMKERGFKCDKKALEEITNVEREKSANTNTKKTDETVYSKETYLNKLMKQSHIHFEDSMEECEIGSDDYVSDDDTFTEEIVGPCILLSNMIRNEYDLHGKIH